MTRITHYCHPADAGEDALRRFIAAVLMCIVCCSTWLPSRTATATAAAAHSNATLNALPLAFEENQGQFDSPADFGARSAGFGLTFGPSGATIHARRRDGTAWPLTLQVLGGAGEVTPEPEERLAGTVNYYRGADPDGWQSGVRTWARIRYAEVYPGIDLVYRGFGSRVEYDFVVSAGADPDDIALVIDGADSLQIDERGRLVARAGSDEFHIDAPFLYQRQAVDQRVDDAVDEVSGRFRVVADNQVRFEVGDYDTQRDLVIDPVLLGYSTRHGGSGADEPREIAVDANGFIYVAGGTHSTDFLGTGAPLGTPANNSDVFVTRIAPDQQTIIYTTILGGSGTEDAVGLAVDDQGHAYVGGQWESSTFPLLNGFDDTLDNAEADYFVARLDGRGQLAYATLYGGDQRDGEFDGGLALGSGNVAYLTGRTQSLPVAGVPNSGLPMQNAYETTCALATCAFVAGIDTRQVGLASLVYSTYIGGDSDEGGKSIAVDADDRIYVFGFTGSDADLIEPGQGFQPASADMNNNDTFLIKLDPALSGANQRLYSTYISGPNDESEDGQVIAGDNGIVWVTGATSSISGPLLTDFPNKNAMQTQNAGSQDAFVMKIDTTLTGDSSLLFATFLGGAGNEGTWGLAIDSTENIYLATSTSSFDFPVVAPLRQFLPFSPPDPMFVQLDPTAMTIETSTPLPGVNRLAVDASDRIYIAGRSQQAVFPLVSPLPPSFVGNAEIFLGRITGRPLSGVTLNVDDIGNPVAVGESVGYRYTLTNNGNDNIDGLTLTSDLPAGLALDFLPSVCFFNGPDMECTPNDLATTPLQPGQNLTWFVRGSAAAAGDYRVTTTSVTTTPTDPDPSDNSDSETITVNATGSTPPGTLKIADFDATGLAFDIGGFMTNTPRGVLASPNGSLDEAASLMIFDGSIPLHIRNIWSQGIVAFGLVERNDWTPAPFDGASLYAEFDTPSDRVYVEVDDMGRVALYSAQAFSPGVFVAETFVGLDPAKAFAIDLAGSTASVFYDGELILQANPFTGGGATQGQVGDDFVISIGRGNENLGAALIDTQRPVTPVAPGAGGIPSGPQVCSQTTFNPSPRSDPGTFGWSTFNTGATSLDWSVSNDIELCGGGTVAAGNLTGGSGDAACIDTDVIGPGAVDSYLCSPQIDLTSTADPDLQFRLAYQIAETAGSEDAFEVLVGMAPPTPATVNGYEVLQSIANNVGSWGGTGEIQNLQLTPGAPVHICFRYAGDYDWYAQVDDVTVSADNCTGPAYGDSDGDGISDEFDNCTDAANPNQIDTDSDGIGNLCDADFNNDCVVNPLDLGPFRQAFFGNEPEYDLNSDGVVNPTDLGILRSQFFGAPGPSAVATGCGSSMCEGTYNAITDGSIYMIGDRSVIGFWNVEICPGSTTLQDGSTWNLIPTTCRCN